MGIQDYAGGSFHLWLESSPVIGSIIIPSLPNISSKRQPPSVFVRTTLDVPEASDRLRLTSFLEIPETQRPQEIISYPMPLLLIQAVMDSRQACRPRRKIKVLVPVEAPVNARPVEGPVVPLRLRSMLPPSKKKGEGHELGRLLHLGPESPLRQQESPERPAKRLVASVLATSLSMTAGIETIFEPITEFDIELQ